MPAAAVVTLVAVGLLILVLAGYLIAVAVILRTVHVRLAAVIASLRGVGDRAQPVAGALEAINLELDNARSSFEELSRVGGRDGEEGGG